MLAIAQKPLMSSSSSVPSSASSVTSSPAANDPCSDNSPYPKIVEGESSVLHLFSFKTPILNEKLINSSS